MRRAKKEQSISFNDCISFKKIKSINYSNNDDNTNNNCVTNEHVNILYGQERKNNLLRKRKKNIRKKK